MEETVLKQVEEIPAGDWVVLSADEKRVVSHDPDLRVALQAAEDQGEKDGVFFRAAPAWSSWIIAF